jgi:hypothetical protein
MKLTCNIDRRGARLRMIGGSVAGVIGILLALTAWWTGIEWMWWPALGFLIPGSIMIFEARNGWCVLRAMGIRTRI